MPELPPSLSILVIGFLLALPFGCMLFSKFLKIRDRHNVNICTDAENAAALITGKSIAGLPDDDVDLQADLRVARWCMIGWNIIFFPAMLGCLIMMVVS